MTDCPKFPGLPVPKPYLEPYQRQEWFYLSPSCTYSKNPLTHNNNNNNTRENYKPPTYPKPLDRTLRSVPAFDSNNQSPLQTNVIYIARAKPGGTYYAFPDAYSSFPYMPCVYPNTSTETYNS